MNKKQIAVIWIGVTLVTAYIAVFYPSLRDMMIVYEFYNFDNIEKRYEIKERQIIEKTIALPDSYTDEEGREFLRNVTEELKEIIEEDEKTQELMEESIIMIPILKQKRDKLIYIMVIGIFVIISITGAGVCLASSNKNKQ